MAPSGAAAEEGSDGELSDSTRAVLAIQRDLKQQDADDGPAPKRARRDGGAPSGRAAGTTAKRGEAEGGGRSLGDSGNRGAITGVRLGEFAPGAKRRAPDRGGGKGGGFGESLESLAGRVESDDEEARAMPEAPAGSYRRRDVAAAEAAGPAGGKPRAKLGIDGKVWDFVGAGPGERSDEAEPEREEGLSAKQSGKEEKGKKRSKQKNDKKKKKKSKDKKKKAKKKKKKKSSSSSSDSSSS